MKRVVISIAGAEGKRDYKDVQLMPGTKPRDVLGTLNLRGYQLAKNDGGAFGNDDDLHEAVKDGEKLFATPSTVEAGGKGTRRELPR